jgi:hypothetical protein
MLGVGGGAPRGNRNNPTGKGLPKKGEPSRCPNGRPKKGTSLTELLRRNGNKTLVIIAEDGKQRRVARKKFIANLVWEILTTGQGRWPDGTSVPRPTMKEWILLCQWMWDKVDVPTKKIDLTTDGKQLPDPRNLLAGLTAETLEKIKGVIEEAEAKEKDGDDGGIL